MKQKYILMLLGLVFGVTIRFMNEHIFRKILSFFMTSRDPHYDGTGFCSFAVGESEELTRFITIHNDAKGNLVFSAFQPEEWKMIIGMCEITGKDIGQFIQEIQKDNESRILVLDPTKFTDNDEDPFGMFE